MHKEVYSQTVNVFFGNDSFLPTDPGQVEGQVLRTERRARQEGEVAEVSTTFLAIRDAIKKTMR